jgi:uncharacterized protein (TIGR02646 family)
MPGELKRDLRQRLLSDQGWICAYCEREIATDTATIEHLDPRSEYPHKQLNYSNMAVVCPGVWFEPRSERTQRRRLHCDKSKGQQVLPLTPLEAECEEAFVYAGDGIALPRAGKLMARAADTLRILNLNVLGLVTTRLERHAGLLIALQGLSDEEVSTYLTVLLQRDPRGRFASHWSVIKQLLADWFPSP